MFRLPRVREWLFAFLPLGRDFFRCCCWERVLARRVVTLFVFVVGREGEREEKGEEDGRQANSR